MVSKLKHKKLLTILIGVCAFVMLCGTVLAVIYTMGVKGVTLAGTKQDAADKNNKAQQEGSVTANSVNAPAVMADGESTDDTSSTTLEGYCTFYDYVVAPYTGNQYKKRGYKEYPKRSINTSSNYSNNGKSKLTVGTTDQNYRQNRYSCLVNGLDVNTCIYYNDGKFKTVSTFDGTKKEYYLASQGIIKGLDPDDYRKVIFNVDEPGLFTDDAKIGKTVIKDYKLVFKKADNGNRSSTYTLDYVLSPKGNKTPAGDNFFPLNDSDSNVPDGGYGGADGNIGTNYYFGMRYDVEFALNGYDDDLLYKFTGDNITKIDSTQLHLINHMKEMGLSEVRIVNLYSEVFERKPAVSQLTYDTENFEYISKVVNDADTDSCKLIIAYGSSLGGNKMTNTIKNARVAAGGKDYEKEPKSYSGYRKIYVMDELMSLLKQQRNKKRFNDSAYLLTDNQMNPIRVWQISDKYRTFMKLLNIEYKSLHVLRHTYGSILASEGIGAKDLQYLLGHASIVTSYNVYIGSYEENRRKATEKLQKSLFVS